MDNEKWIVRNEVLDSILSLFLSFDVPIFKNMLDKINPTQIDMDFVAKTLSQYDWEDWMKKSFKDELLHKNFLVEDADGNLKITEIGREFKRKGGYNAIDKREGQEEIIREKQVESLTLDVGLKRFNKKYNQKFIVGGFIILILNFIITLMTLQNFNEQSVGEQIPEKKESIEALDKNNQNIPNKENLHKNDMKLDSLNNK